jgi:hypothetical protein
VTLRSLTPPKFVATLREKDANLLLEQRLQHFTEWLRTEHRVTMCRMEAGDVEDEDVQELIREYVDT